MSEKKPSASHQNREVAYLKPCDKIFISAYHKVHGTSKSDFISNAVHDHIKAIPQDVRTQILRRAKSDNKY